MARVYAARRRLEERHGVPETLKKLAEAGASSAASADSTVERLARVIASTPEHPGATELVLATMRAVDGMEASAEVVERAATAQGVSSSGPNLASRFPSSSWT